MSPSQLSSSPTHTLWLCNFFCIDFFCFYLSDSQLYSEHNLADLAHPTCVHWIVTDVCILGLGCFMRHLLQEPLADLRRKNWSGFVTLSLLGNLLNPEDLTVKGREKRLYKNFFKIWSDRTVTDSLCVWGLLTTKITISTPMCVLVCVTTCAKETNINVFPTGAHMATSSYHFQHHGIQQHDLTHEKNTQSVSQQWLCSKRMLAEKKCVQLL